jgi:hypothetical protein
MRAIAAWAIGWAIGAITFVVGFVVLGAWRAEAITALFIVLGSAVSFGVPSYVGSRHAKSNRRLVQSLVWFVCFAIAGLLLSKYYLAQTALALPGELNINTDATMRARQASFDRWGAPPETVSSFVFTFEVLCATCFASGLLSAMAAAGWRVPDLIRAMLFGLATIVAIVAGLFVVFVATYGIAVVVAATRVRLAVSWLAPLPMGFVLAAMIAGCVAGSISEYARGILLPRAR